MTLCCPCTVPFSVCCKPATRLATEASTLPTLVLVSPGPQLLCHVANTGLGNQPYSHHCTSQHTLRVPYWPRLTQVRRAPALPHPTEGDPLHSPHDHVHLRVHPGVPRGQWPHPSRHATLIRYISSAPTLLSIVPIASTCSSAILV